MITIAGIIALITGLALAQSTDLANPEQPPANIRMAPAANAQVAGKNANEDSELCVTYHLGVIDGRSFATMLPELFSAKGIHITTQLGVPVGQDFPPTSSHSTRPPAANR